MQEISFDTQDFTVIINFKKLSTCKISKILYLLV